MSRLLLIRLKTPDRYDGCPICEKNRKSYCDKCLIEYSTTNSCFKIAVDRYLSRRDLSSLLTVLHKLKMLDCNYFTRSHEFLCLTAIKLNYPQILRYMIRKYPESLKYISANMVYANDELYFMFKKGLPIEN